MRGNERSKMWNKISSELHENTQGWKKNVVFKRQISRRWLCNINEMDLTGRSCERSQHFAGCTSSGKPLSASYSFRHLAAYTTIVRPTRASLLLFHYLYGMGHLHDYASCKSIVLVSTVVKGYLIATRGVSPTKSQCKAGSARHHSLRSSEYMNVEKREA